MIVDAFTFYNEIDMLDLRLRLLYDHVDAFVIVEADHTFQGKPKPFHLDAAMERFAWAQAKMIRHKAPLTVEGMNFGSPTGYDPGSAYFQLEYQQRNAIVDACRSFDDDAVVLLSDVDEIPSLEVIDFARREDHKNLPLACDQTFFYYNLCHMRAERWRGTIIATMAMLRQYQPQGLRNARNRLQALQPGGWHLSYFGNAEFIANKINAFAHQEYNNEAFKDRSRIESCIKGGADLFGRDVPMSVPKRADLPDYFWNAVTPSAAFFGYDDLVKAWTFVPPPAVVSPAPNRIQGSDKFYWHRYVDAYEPHFAKLGEVSSILEFGVLRGESIRWLRERFPAASIVGVDILPVRPEWPQDAKIRYLQLDQGRRQDIAALFQGLGTVFDLVIEDGSHIPQHQASCLAESLRWVRDGGLYILEDISTSHPDNADFAPANGGKRQPNALNALLAIQHAKERGVALTAEQMRMLAAPGFFSVADLEIVSAHIDTLRLYKRTSLPLECWRCRSSDFDYVQLKCACGTDLYATADSMSYILNVKNAEARGHLGADANTSPSVEVDAQTYADFLQGANAA